MKKVNFPLQLDAKGDWFLGADSQQWILYRLRTAKGKSLLVGQSFFGSTKETMINAITVRYKIVIIDEAREIIDSLPDMFLEFQRVYKTKSGKGRKKKVLTDD